MNYILSLALALVLTTKSYSQKLIENYIPQKDSLRVGTAKDDFLYQPPKNWTDFSKQLVCF
jgi:hypothetical protein